MKDEMTIMHAQEFSGPLPRPTDLEKYDRIIPGAAERILQMAEKEQQARLENTRQAQRANIHLAKAGQTIGFILALVFAALAVLFAHWGHVKLAASVGVPLIIWVCSIFVLRKSPQNK